MGRPELPDSEYTSAYRKGPSGHRAVAERALGRPLPPGAVVHHVDEDPLNNTPSNLVICPSEAYHNLLHMRQEALNACGHADWKKCYVCKAYDEESNLTPLVKPNRNVTTFYHPACRREYRRLAYAAKKAS